MPSLRAIVAAQTALADELPLVHNTRCELLEGIFARGSLAEPACEIFGEELVYLFYGRPAYRQRNGHLTVGEDEVCPVCFVFRPGALGGAVRRVFVCDTGAVHYEFFKPFLWPPDGPQLELEPRIASAQRLVPLVFGDNYRYYFGRAKAALPEFAGAAVATKYHQLLLDTVHVRGDDRRSAVEVQVPSPVSVAGQLDCVILPDAWLGRPNVQSIIENRWGCDIVPYDVMRGTAINECVAVIRTLLRQRLGLTYS